MSTEMRIIHFLVMYTHPPQPPQSLHVQAQIHILLWSESISKSPFHSQEARKVRATSFQSFSLKIAHFSIILALGKRIHATPSRGMLPEAFRTRGRQPFHPVPLPAFALSDLTSWLGHRRLISSSVPNWRASSCSRRQGVWPCSGPAARCKIELELANHVFPSSRSHYQLSLEEGDEAARWSIP